MMVRRLRDLFPTGEREGGGTAPVPGDTVMAHIVLLASATAATALVMMSALAAARLNAKPHPEKMVCRSANLC